MGEGWSVLELTTESERGLELVSAPERGLGFEPELEITGTSAVEPLYEDRSRLRARRLPAKTATIMANIV